MVKKTVVAENVNTPGQVVNLDAEKYHDMKQAMLKVMPSSTPGMTHKEIMEAVLPHLSTVLFPQGAKRGWWSKAVQLDLEAKEIIVREPVKPLRWHIISK